MALLLLLFDPLLPVEEARDLLETPFVWITIELEATFPDHVRSTCVRPWGHIYLCCNQAPNVVVVDSVTCPGRSYFLQLLSLLLGNLGLDQIDCSMESAC